MTGPPERLALLHRVVAKQWSPDDPELQEVLDDAKAIEKLSEEQPYLTPEIMSEYVIARDPFPKRKESLRLLGGLVTRAFPGEYRTRTWGFAIIRTAYDKGASTGEWDAKFQTALSVIRRAVPSPLRTRTRPEYPTKPDRRAEDELAKRFVNDVLEDREVLADATVGEVSEHFRRWASARWKPMPMPPNFFSAYKSRRLKSCILLDAETIEQLQEATTLMNDSTVLELYPRLKQFWVKAVEAEPQRRNEDDDGNGGSLWCDCYRVRIHELAQFWWDGAYVALAGQRTREPDPLDDSIRYYIHDYWEPPNARVTPDASVRISWPAIGEPLPEVKAEVPRDKRMAISSLLV
ncbi:hypothetical protein PG993_013199 [Apiospora rasikravindrae]|uniref:Uncharacterized protein n=1 Tax=Apiospora rasikravindrae TaxID=990691 RepID=A0ABR1RY78_9PEZI